jgi:tRNA threonylcarbamoyl adenosine modification protein (Sua5/YciO/YrdC/YwlC family)
MYLRLMLLKLHPDNPSDRRVRQVSQILQNNGIIVFPTDTVYALACSIYSKRAFEKMCRLRAIQPKKAVFSMICSDMNQASPFLSQISTPTFRVLNKNLPGPFTFILRSGRELPSHMRNGRKTIGLRIPDHPVTQAIVKELGTPLITTSLRSDDDILEYYVDPEEMFEEYGKLVDCVVDSGTGHFYPSTVVDMTSNEIDVIRQGKWGLINN